MTRQTIFSSKHGVRWLDKFNQQNMSNHIPLGYSEITEIKVNEDALSALIGLFNKEATFGLLTMVNNFLALFPANFEESKFRYIQGFLTRNLLKKEIYEIWNEKFGEVTLYNRPIFHRQQVLFLMKRVLLYGLNEGGLNPNHEMEARYKLGDVCLIINDLIITEEQEKRTESKNPNDKQEHDRVLAELLAQMLPTTELLNPPSIDSAIARTLNYIEISSSHFPDKFNGQSLSSLFESITGIGLKRFLQMILGIYTWLVTQELDDLIQDSINFNLRKSKWFSNLNYSQKEIDSFFNLTAIDFNQLVLELNNNPLNTSLSQQYDFTIFRKYPTFYLTNDIFTFIDFSFVTEKASLGLYHTILNSLPQDGLRDSFFQHWGYVFEKYVNNIFREIYPEIINRFHPNTFFETQPEKEAFDGIIEYPNALLVMEYKGGMLNTKAKYNGFSEPLLEEMGKKFGYLRKDAGIRQLSTKIEHLFNSNFEDRLEIRSLKFENIRVIYPILILNDVSMEFGLANWRMRTWFDEEIKAKKIDGNTVVKPLMVLTIEDLEMITPYLEAGDFTLLDFAEFYSQLEYIRFSWFLIREQWFEPMTTIGQAFHKFRQSKGKKFRLNERIQDKWNRFVAEIHSSFKENFRENSL